jgi:hypothetical protein
LEEKLDAFCRRFARVETFAAGPDNDRRREERHPLSFRTSMVLLDSRGQSAGIGAVVELVNICTGGVACRQSLAGRENGRLLLGRKIRLQLPSVGQLDTIQPVDGDILAVHDHPDGTAMVHIRFDIPLTQRQLEEILRVASDRGPAA